MGKTSWVGARFKALNKPIFVAASDLSCIIFLQNCPHVLEVTQNPKIITLCIIIDVMVPQVVIARGYGLTVSSSKKAGLTVRQ